MALTKEQITAISNEVDGLFTWLPNDTGLAICNAIYAAGMAAGEAKERERCVKICDDQAAYLIRDDILKEQK